VLTYGRKLLFWIYTKWIVPIFGLRLFIWMERRAWSLPLRTRHFPERCTPRMQSAALNARLSRRRPRAATGWEEPWHVSYAGWSNQHRLHAIRCGSPIRWLAPHERAAFLQRSGTSGSLRTEISTAECITPSNVQYVSSENLNFRVVLAFVFLLFSLAYLQKHWR
jgi:hypothetical protein